jgi:hypothetical protein
MTPKEKAKELVGRFYVWTSRNTTKVNIAHYDAKQCALICVDEIISKGGTKNVIQYEPNCFTNGVEYWQEVKQEIEKL